MEALIARAGDKHHCPPNVNGRIPAAFPEASEEKEPFIQMEGRMSAALARHSVSKSAGDIKIATALRLS